MIVTLGSCHIAKLRLNHVSHLSMKHRPAAEPTLQYVVGFLDLLVSIHDNAERVVANKLNRSPRRVRVCKQNQCGKFVNPIINLP